MNGLTNPFILKLGRKCATWMNLKLLQQRKDQLKPLNNAQSVSLVRGEAVQLILNVTSTLPRYRSPVRTWFPDLISFLSMI